MIKGCPAGRINRWERVNSEIHIKMIFSFSFSNSVLTLVEEAGTDYQ